MSYRVFINIGLRQDWIIERLMTDISRELMSRGIEVSVGFVEDYRNEEVVFNARFLYPHYFEAAKVNSLFVTHVDDLLKEAEISTFFESFESFVCMSPDSALHLVDLGLSPSRVVGIELPHRIDAIRPLKFSVFSAFYPDKRKNEEWIIDYFKRCDPRFHDLCVIKFLGDGWHGVLSSLSEIGISTEMYDYKRTLPGEYKLLREVLSQSDYMLYTGFDGGAMCVYDGVAEGLSLIISDVCYHKDLGVGEKLFSDKKQFYQLMDECSQEKLKMIELMKSRSIEKYVDKLLEHWGSFLENDNSPMNNEVNKLNESNLLKRRSRYFRLTPMRLMSGIKRLLIKV